MDNQKINTLNTLLLTFGIILTTTNFALLAKNVYSRYFNETRISSEAKILDPNINVGIGAFTLSLLATAGSVATTVMQAKGNNSSVVKGLNIACFCLSGISFAVNLGKNIPSM